MELCLLGLFIPAAVKGWVAAIAVPIAVAALAVLAFKVDTKKENVRRSAIDLSRKLNENGLTILDGFLENFAVGDRSGMVKSLMELGTMVKDPEAFAAHTSKLFMHQLQMRIADPAKRIEIAKALGNQVTLERADTEEKVKANKNQ